MKKKMTEAQLLKLAEKDAVKFAQWKKDGKKPEGWVRNTYGFGPEYLPDQYPTPLQKKIQDFFIYWISAFVVMVIATQIWEGLRYVWLMIGITAQISVLVIVSGLFSYYWTKYQLEIGQSPFGGDN